MVFVKEWRFFFKNTSLLSFCIQKLSVLKRIILIITQFRVFKKSSLKECWDFTTIEIQFVYQEGHLLSTSFFRLWWVRMHRRAWWWDYIRLASRLVKIVFCVFFALYNVNFFSLIMLIFFLLIKVMCCLEFYNENAFINYLCDVEKN